ncbi:MAG: tetratricopeptide repeat protein [Acidobacteriia bacterium]|nr:tetratricopeptide repeat protein [Terriglobia bacterium]
MDKRNTKHDREIPDEFLKQLREDIAWRRIASGLQCLAAHKQLVESCEPRQKNAAILLEYFAQWVDIGFSGRRLLKRLLSRFSGVRRESLSLLEFAHLRMAEGLMAMAEEEFGKAIKCFETVLALEEEISDKPIMSIANFWVGRCLRRQGRYDDALGYVAKARELALRLKYPKMAAVMHVLEGWIAFQEGHPEEAARILREAEEVLADTDDWVTLGNISSAYGRIARRRGNYEQALSKFEKAIEQYNQRDPFNRNLARSFVNIAFVKRLLALQLANKMDSEAAKSRKRRQGGAKSAAFPKLRGREQLTRLRAEAFEHLAKAREIYDRYDDHRGNGNVHVTFGYLNLDDGELDRAAAEGATAFRLGDEKKDIVLKARARMLQSAVECAKFEEQIEEGSSRVPSSQLACEFSREALESAKHTQNRRLIAKAHIALGLALCLGFPEDLEAAQQCADGAAALLKPAHQDYVWRELQELKRKLRGAGNISSTLREWSQGIVGNKSFQQVSEEFAALVIPKVWRHEGCKVARVAARLSISPKKVRRILRDQGLLKGAESG